MPGERRRRRQQHPRRIAALDRDQQVAGGCRLTEPDRVAHLKVLADQDPVRRQRRRLRRHCGFDLRAVRRRREARGRHDRQRHRPRGVRIEGVVAAPLPAVNVAGFGTDPIGLSELDTVTSNDGYPARTAWQRRSLLALRIQRAGLSHAVASVSVVFGDVGCVVKLDVTNTIAGRRKIHGRAPPDRSSPPSPSPSRSRSRRAPARRTAVSRRSCRNGDADRRRTRARRRLRQQHLRWIRTRDHHRQVPGRRRRTQRELHRGPAGCGRPSAPASRTSTARATVMVICRCQWQPGIPQTSTDCVVPAAVGSNDWIRRA